MSYTVLLQTNMSQDNALDKSVTTLSTVECNLKSDTSLIDPVLVISISIGSLAGCNYFTIPKFNRKYFVRNITSLRNGCVEITGHVDVLSSFNTAIRNNTAIIERQEKQWNLYLDDGTFKTYSNPYILTKKFPKGFGTYNFVLAVAGK